MVLVLQCADTQQTWHPACLQRFLAFLCVWLPERAHNNLTSTYYMLRIIDVPPKNSPRQNQSCLQENPLIWAL